MALLDVIANLQGKAGALSGIRSAPTNPTESVNQFPAAVTFVQSFEAETITAGLLKRIIVIRTLIFDKRTHLPIDVATMTPYGDSFPIAVYADPRLGNTVQTIERPMTGTFGHIEYEGKANYIGWTFDTTVKVEDNT